MRFLNLQELGWETDKKKQRSVFREEKYRMAKKTTRESRKKINQRLIDNTIGICSRKSDWNKKKHGFVQT